MTAAALISESDWLRLRAALRHMDEVSLERTLGRISVQAATARVKRAWPVAMVVSLRVDYPGGSQRQHFESIKAARQAAERWSIKIDGNKRNYAPENLMVFPSQSEHMKWHIAHDPRYRRAAKGGEANEVPTHAAPADLP